MKRRHPSDAALYGFARGESDGTRRARVADHLSDCASCRRRVSWIRALPSELQRAFSGDPHDGMERRILESRAAGLRAILPTRDPETRRVWFGRRTGAGVLLAAIAALLTGLLLRTPEVGARTSELSFEPMRPVSGATIEVTYRPARDLAEESVVALRGRLAPPIASTTPPPDPERIAYLEREGTLFRGRFTLPPETVFGQFVVEDLDGDVIDHRQADPWTLYVHERGRPVFEALRAGVYLAFGWVRTDETLRELTRRYPDDIRIRAMRLGLEAEMQTRAERDSALRRHRRRGLSDIDTVRSRSGGPDALGPEDLAALAAHAAALGDTASARFWRRALVTRHPSHPEAVWHRVPPPPSEAASADSAASRRSWRAYLADLEALWRSAGPHPAIAPAGFHAARALRDTSAVLLWAQRRLAHRGWGDSLVAIRVAREIAGLDGGLAEPFIRLALRELTEADPGRRPLTRSVEGQRQATRRAVAPLLLMLGDIVAERRPAAAIDTYRVVAAESWRPSAHVRIAEAEAAGGDTASAVAHLAAARALSAGRAVPSGGPEAPEALDRRGIALVGPDRWSEIRARARREVFDELLARSSARHLSLSSIEVRDRAGRRHSLASLTGGAPALVALWNPVDAGSIRAMSELNRVGLEAGRRGAVVVVVTKTPPGPRFDRLLDEHGVELAVHYDVDREANRVFEHYGGPEYVILDSEGTMRFRLSDPGDALLAIASLSEHTLAP